MNDDKKTFSNSFLVNNSLVLIRELNVPLWVCLSKQQENSSNSFRGTNSLKLVNINKLKNLEIEKYLLSINLFITQKTFQVQWHYYNQTQGTAMDDPLPCLIANAFFAVFNKKQNISKCISNLNSFYVSWSTHNMNS